MSSPKPSLFLSFLLFVTLLTGNFSFKIFDKEGSFSFPHFLSLSLEPFKNNPLNLLSYDDKDQTLNELDYLIFLPMIQNKFFQEEPSLTWKLIDSPTTTKLNDVYALSSDNVWVVGDNGLILNWDGTSWHSIDSSVTYNIREISMKNESEGFAQTNSPIIKWNGSFWEEVNDFTTNAHANLTNDGTNFWFVGGTVRGDSSTMIYEAEIFKWNNLSQSSETFTIRDAIYYDIEMVSNNDGWAVGSKYSDATSATARWDGTQWNFIPTPPIKYLTDISAIDSTHAIAIGKDLSDQCVSLIWNGSSWNPVVCPTGSMFLGVDIVNANLSMAVGSGGTIAYFDGTSWKLLTSPVTENLMSIYMLSDNEGWAVGENGVILHYSSGIH